MDDNNPQTPEYSLADDLNTDFQAEPASMGQRFLNWLIDNLVMRFGLSYITGTAVGYLLGTFFPEFIMRIVEKQDGNMMDIDLLVIAYLIGVLNYITYYTICEKGFKGYTLGKLVTGTRAVREDGHELSFKDALLRSLCRIVPFEAFSALGRRPWHDSWTKTWVIKTR